MLSRTVMASGCVKWGHCCSCHVCVDREQGDEPTDLSVLRHPACLGVQDCQEIHARLTEEGRPHWSTGHKDSHHSTGRSGQGGQSCCWWTRRDDLVCTLPGCAGDFLVGTSSFPGIVFSLGAISVHIQLLGRLFLYW